ncbi:MAG: hypothetical protein ABEJ88_04550 [Halobacterium sp.]
MACAVDGCDRPAAVRVHDPRGPDRDVCPAHARGLVQRDGVVATPLEDAGDEWP